MRFKLAEKILIMIFVTNKVVKYIISKNEYKEKNSTYPISYIIMIKIYAFDNIKSDLCMELIRKERTGRDNRQVC